jgi:hypothetical protein
MDDLKNLAVEINPRNTLLRNPASSMEFYSWTIVAISENVVIDQSPISLPTCIQIDGSEFAKRRKYRITIDSNSFG